MMLWTFAIYATCYTVFVTKTLNVKTLHNFSLRGVIAITIISIAFPISGWLADVYVGRYRVLWASMWLVWVGAVGTVLTSILNIVGKNIPKQVKGTANVIFVIPMCLGFAGFVANGIPFAIDQMPEASGEEVSAFINWYIWASVIGRTLSILALIAIGCYKELDREDQDIEAYITIFVLTVLTIAVCSGMIFHSCLIIDPQSHNPWKTVLGVLKYAAIHKRPENRSARTYCEDSPPSRMDLGKDRYGGPYTNEQVEDVKTFLRIMTVIVSVSMVIIPVYLCANAEDSILLEDKESCKQKGLTLLYNDGFFIALGIPLFELVINPLIRKKIPVKYTPQMLTSTLYAAIMAIVISIYILTIDIVGRLHGSDEFNGTCIIKNTYKRGFSMLSAKTVLLLSILYHFLQAIQNVLYRVSLLKFSCAQAPHSMKGLIIGLMFTVIYLSQGVAFLIKEAFHKGWTKNNVVSIASKCDFWYFVTACVFSIAGLVVLSCITRCYKQRQREEPNYDRIFAEVYFTNNISDDTTSINSDAPSWQ